MKRHQAATANFDFLREKSSMFFPAEEFVLREIRIKTALVSRTDNIAVVQNVLR